MEVSRRRFFGLLGGVTGCVVAAPTDARVITPPPNGFSLAGKHALEEYTRLLKCDVNRNAAMDALIESVAKAQ